VAQAFLPVMSGHSCPFIPLPAVASDGQECPSDPGKNACATGTLGNDRHNP
jgi:hypothetical protein